jgi:hypothetical protein
LVDDGIQKAISGNSRIQIINPTGPITMTESKGNVQLTGIEGNISGLVVAGETASIAGSTIGVTNGNATNTINQHLGSDNSDEPDLKALLQELEAAIKVDPNLSDTDKAEALEQVKAIDEGKKQPKEGAIQKSVKTAIKVLKGTVADLPATEELVKVSIKVLPLIAKFFGLP